VTAAARKLTSAVGTAKLTSLIEASHRVVLDGSSGSVYAVRLLMPHFPLGIGKTPKEAIAIAMLFLDKVRANLEELAAEESPNA